ncbi:hypothetical protein L1D34_07285 [Vibrio mediterranei]|uniref:hypothetical protein n=1 Tax=Vibrio mediterranei TaxID=689 RepID=UPI001EFE94B8|nr:hypothetical protein [Vibrio mediterranei]MCG9624642.1 hypothetical protein [Vibrio mediterranei]
MFWGVDDPDVDQEDALPELWEENLDAMEWWLSIPNFLTFVPNIQAGRTVCTGMNVEAVKADAEMSKRDINPSDYDKLKAITRTLVEEYNA